MPENNFTKRIKNNLSTKLNERFTWKSPRLKSSTEHRVNSIYGKNGIDIAIHEEGNIDKLVGIEIEFISHPDQIELNRNKFRNWVHNSKNRSGGLLHVICEDTNISQTRLVNLLVDNYFETSKDSGYFYELYVLKINDKRATQIVANELVCNWEFEARLDSLVKKVFDL